MNSKRKTVYLRMGRCYRSLDAAWTRVFRTIMESSDEHLNGREAPLIKGIGVYTNGTKRGVYAIEKHYNSYGDRMGGGRYDYVIHSVNSDSVTDGTQLVKDFTEDGKGHLYGIAYVYFDGGKWYCPSTSKDATEATPVVID